MVALAKDTVIWQTVYPAGTDHTVMPLAVVAAIRNPDAWVGGVAPPLSGAFDRTKRLKPTDLKTAGGLRDAIGLSSPLIALPPLTVPGTISAPVVGLSRLYNDYGFTITIASVRIAVGTAPSGSLVVDVKKNGVSIFANTGDRPSLTSGQNTVKVVPTPTVSFAPNDYLTSDIVTGTSGAGLVVSVTGIRAAF